MGSTYEKPMSDPVNHPKHYVSHPSGIECIAVVEHMTFNVGNVIKYLWRAGLKEGSEGIEPKLLEDLKKARWYLDREIAKKEQELDLPKAPPQEAWTEEAPLEELDPRKSTPWPQGLDAGFCVTPEDFPGSDYESDASLPSLPPTKG
jgi:hypothetical protein